MFNGCINLETVPELDGGKCRNVGYMFNSCSKLKNFGGLKNYGQAFLPTDSRNSTAFTLSFSSSPSMTHDSLMNVINKLYDIATKGCNTQQLVLGSTNLAKLSASEIQTATDKGWSLS